MLATLDRVCECVQYIYISKQEMEAVAEYIKKRGRIAIGELASKSNMFIDLEAKATAVSSALCSQVDVCFEDVSACDHCHRHQCILKQKTECQVCTQVSDSMVTCMPRAQSRRTLRCVQPLSTRHDML